MVESVMVFVVGNMVEAKMRGCLIKSRLCVMK